jgi:hypothetical protein
MPRLPNLLHRALHTAEKTFDDLSLRLKRRLGLLDPIQIVPYRGFGDAGRLTLTGSAWGAGHGPRGCFEIVPWWCLSAK